MLNMNIQLSGFDEFMRKLEEMKGTTFISRGMQKFVEHARQVVIDGTPVGKPEEDDHPGLMKKSWEQPKYVNLANSVKATVTNSVDYGMASNYGHRQNVGMYVPKINARLVHEWVPGTYALESSLDKAEMQFESIIRPEILKTWEETRTDYYDRRGDELIDTATYESDE